MKTKILKLGIIFVVISGIFSYSRINADDKKIVDNATIEKTEEISKAGTYFVTSAIQDDYGNEISRVVRIHVKYPNTVLNYDGEEGIDAHDIVVQPNVLETLNNDELIVEGWAHAWSMSDGSEVAVANVAKGNASKDFAISDVIYGTAKGTKVNVSVYTQDEIHLGFDEVYINYNSIFENKYLLLSLLVLFLTVIPVVIYILMFLYLEHKNKEANNLLYKE